ncbi:hypothetical protein GCM10007424_24150 [Flavobacterium suaedae]|uniref:Beta-lactamase-related domain-containing protein n=2 Tax=Flavobacterium suaedae TaxID=1767027 RepID=A0ABQ1K2L7_9FLAO|nr:hypothetical protein GCM10007424_24150 [Flavobacterium suaedae]
MGILLKKDGQFCSQRLNFENNDNTVFNIGSATKTFTAVLILQEVEKGTLKLSDSIGKFLSPIKNIPSDITIEQLLRHQTGLAETVGDQEWDSYNIPNDSLLRRDVLNNVKPRHNNKIGKFEYTNTNYILLGEILEKINDKSYFDLLEERIFKPCHLEYTYPYVSKNIPQLVHPTDEKNESDQFNGINYKFFADYAFSAGSIASTLKDMATFYENLFEKETLISKRSLQKMTGFKGGDYGLGLQKLKVSGIEYWGHGGNNYGYAFRNYYNPKSGEMILYFINRFRVPMKNSLLKDLVAVLDSRPIQQFRKNIVDEFKDFEGDYVLKGPDLPFTIFERDNLLYFQVENLKVPLVSYEPTILLDVSSGIKFTKSENNPNQLIWSQSGQKLKAVRQ